MTKLRVTFFFFLTLHCSSTEGNVQDPQYISTDATFWGKEQACPWWKEKKKLLSISFQGLFFFFKVSHSFQTSYVLLSGSICLSICLAIYLDLIDQFRCLESCCYIRWVGTLFLWKLFFEGAEIKWSSCKKSINSIGILFSLSNSHIPLNNSRSTLERQYFPMVKSTESKARMLGTDSDKRLVTSPCASVSSSRKWESQKLIT